jgi:signal transduction histidine kinase
LYEDAEGTLWIGTYDGGLGRLKNGRFTRYTVKEGLFNNGVFCILEDAKGNLWMSSNRGIYRIRRQELNDYAEGRRHDISSISYGRQDGLTNIECNGGRQPAGFKMSDGKLWFPTQGGVAVIDPESISENRHVPEVVIEHCLIQRNEADCRQEIEIKPGKDNLEIVYTGLSFIKSDQIHFKYKLEGWDRDWVDAGTRRAAYYANLPPGHYDFKVIAANSDGVWNNTGTSLSVVVVPPFWRTWWFLSLAGLTIAATAFLAYRRRVDSLRRAHAAQEAFSRQLIESQEHEKKRIAAELHDSLGQNLLIIKNRALLGTESATNHQEFKERFDSISASASQAIDEVRQIAYNLRPYLLDRLGLTNALEDMLERVAASTDIHFTVEIDSIDGLFSKDQEINVFRLIQECVNNVVKHSRATEASVRIKRTSQTIDIRIEDNGQGFLPDRDKSNRHGFGLTGTAERVKMLGGQYRIDSTVGASTAVIIQIDLNSKIPDVK